MAVFLQVVSIRTMLDKLVSNIVSCWNEILNYNIDNYVSKYRLFLFIIIWTILLFLGLIKDYYSGLENPPSDVAMDVNMHKKIISKN